MPVSLPTDQLLLGKLPFIQNGRVTKDYQIDSRLGYTLVQLVTASILHSIRRINDQLPGAAFANGRVLGAGGNVYVLNSGGLSAADAGYSGNPLSLVAFRPERSVEPWVYIFDSGKLRKVRADATFFNTGIAPPLTAPTVALGAPVYNLFNDAEVTTGWANGGTMGALSTAFRFNASSCNFLWDNLATNGPGWASVVPVVWIAQFQPGADITFTLGGFTTQEVIIQSVLPAPDTAKILSISYDSGVTGLCTIHASVQLPKKPVPTIPGGPLRPLGPLGPGILGLPGSILSRIVLEETKYMQTQLDWVNSGWVMDAVLSFPGGLGRIISVTTGPDGTASVRMNLTFTANVGDTMTGKPSFRSYFANTMGSPAPGSGHYITGAATTGIAFATFTGALNLGQVSLGGGNVRPVQDGDYVHFSIFLNNPSNLIEGRLLLDVDATTNDFAHNYYEIPFTQSDLQSATTNQQNYLTTKGQIIQKSLQQLSPSDYRALASRFGGPLTKPPVRTPNLPRPIVPPPAQMGPGELGWTEILVRVSDMQRIGTDLSRTLANVAAVRVQFNLSAAENPGFDSLWVGGTYGPDVGTLGAPMLWRYRYRSSTTGARSLCGPPIRSGLLPHNQQVQVTMTASPDPQFDYYDVYRWGGSITQWTFAGALPASAGNVFIDALTDDTIAANDLIETDTFQPFPTLDIPRKGTCNVVGTKIIQTGGDTFNLNWYPGSEIYINGLLTNIYSQPSDATHLEVVDNMGTQSGVSFLIPQATLLAQPLPCAWGPFPGSLNIFACGDLYQPGVLFWTNGNDADAASDLNQLEVSSPSESLMNGGIYDDLPFVFSTERCWILYPDFQTAGSFNAVPAEVARGLYCKWMLAIGKKGIYFGGKDGIYRTNYGPADSITDASLYALFPHGENSVGTQVIVGGVTLNPPDLKNHPERARLSFVGDLMFFDYLDTNGTPCTWVYDEKVDDWVSFDVSTPAMATHYSEDGTVRSLLAGGVDGRLCQSGGFQDVGGAAINVIVASKRSSSHGMEQYGSLRDGQFKHLSNAPVTLQITLDRIAANPITLASTGGAEKKVYLPGIALKGKLLNYVLSTVAPYRLFPIESALRLDDWKAGGSLRPVGPFVGVS